MGFRMTKVVLFDLGDTLFRLLPMSDVTEEFAKLMAAEGVEDADDEATRVLETFRERLMAGYGRGDLLEPPIAEVVLPFIGADRAGPQARRGTRRAAGRGRYRALGTG